MANMSTDLIREMVEQGVYENPNAPRVPNRWSVMVLSGGVVGCVGAFRWRWRARMKGRSTIAYWPGPKQVFVVEPDVEA